ncbi:TlpA family protein disulfide reductase [Nitratifractor sp.]
MRTFLLTLTLPLFVWAGGATPAPKAGSGYHTLTTIDGKTIHYKGTRNGLEIKEYKGKIVFLEFWGTHCPPCRMSIPHYIALNKKYKDKLAMLAVEVQDTPKALLKQFVQSRGINYDVVAYRDALPFVNYIARRAQWNGSIPFLIIFDQNGNVVTMQVGLLNEKALAGVIEELSKIQAKKSAASTPKKPAPKQPAKQSAPTAAH